MDTDTYMTGVSDPMRLEDNDEPDVLVWVHLRDPEEMEDEDESPLSIMIGSNHEERYIRVDKFSQQAAEKLLTLELQADVEGLTGPELRKRAQDVISVLVQQIPDGKYRWGVTDEETAYSSSQGGLPRRQLRSIASTKFIDGLVDSTIASGTERDTEMGEGGSRDLAQEMSDMNLKG